MEAVSPGVRSFVLPYPPSVDHYWRRVGDAGLVSRHRRAFREAVCALLAGSAEPALAGRLAVRILACPPDARRPALGSIQKALLDALGHGGVFGDDGQIDCLFIERGPILPGGRVLVQVTEVAS